MTSAQKVRLFYKDIRLCTYIVYQYNTMIQNTAEPANFNKQQKCEFNHFQ